MPERKPNFAIDVFPKSCKQYKQFMGRGYLHLKRYFLFFFSGFHWVLLDGFLCHRSQPTSCWKDLATIVFGGFHGFGRTKCFFMALESVLLPGERNSLAPILVPTLPPRSQHLASNPILINNPNLSTSIQTNPILTNNPNRPKSLNNMLQWSLGWPPSPI